MSPNISRRLIYSGLALAILSIILRDAGGDGLGQALLGGEPIVGTQLPARWPFSIGICLLLWGQYHRGLAQGVGADVPTDDGGRSFSTASLVPESEGSELYLRAEGAHASPQEPVQTERLIGDVGKENYLTKHWRGDFSLGYAFWVNLILASILTIALELVVSTASATQRPASMTSVSALAAFGFGFAVWLWGAIGVWRSATRSMRVPHPSAWAYVACFVVLIQGIAYASRAGGIGKELFLATSSPDGLNVVTEGQKIDSSVEIVRKLERDGTSKGRDQDHKLVTPDRSLDRYRQVPSYGRDDPESGRTVELAWLAGSWAPLNDGTADPTIYCATDLGYEFGPDGSYSGAADAGTFAIASGGTRVSLSNRSGYSIGGGEAEQNIPLGPKSLDVARSGERLMIEGEAYGRCQ